MHRLRKSIDPGLLLTLALTCFLALPLAGKAGLPDGQDLQIQALPGLLLLCFALCSGGMYAFCQRRSGRLGALIAGLVYVYSPYLMYDTAIARGAYGELLALALFPLLLWRIDALRDRPTPVSFLLVCLLQAALLNTQLRTALVLTGIAFAWLASETLIQRFNREASQMPAGSSLLAALAILLGLAAGASAGLPMSQAEVTAAPDVPLRFLWLEDLLSPPPVHDAGAINSLRAVPILGLAQWTLAGLGALAALLLYIGGYRTRHPNAFLGAAIFAGLAALLIALMLPTAHDLWSGSPLLQQLRAPSRLLGPSAACLAIAASMNGLWLGKLNARYQIGTIAIVVAAPIVAVIPLLYAPERRLVSDVAGAKALVESAGAGAGFVSAAAALLAIGLAWRLRALQLTPRPYWTAPALPRRQALGILLGGVIALFSLLITYREGVAWLKSPPGQALPARFQRQVSLDDSLQLLGYDLNADVFRPGDRLVFNAYWYARERLTVDYSSFLHASSGGNLRLLARKRHPSGWPGSQTWGPEGYVVDEHALHLPADLPAGAYDLTASLLDCDRRPLDDCAERVQASLSDEPPGALGGSILIATIRVEAP